MMKEAQGVDKSVDVLCLFVRDFNVEIDDSFVIKEFKVIKQESLISLRSIMLNWKAFELDVYKQELFSCVEKKYVKNDE